MLTESESADEERGIRGFLPGLRERLSVNRERERERESDCVRVRVKGRE